MLNALKSPSTMSLTLAQVSLTVLSLVLHAQEYNKRYGELIDVGSIFVFAAIALVLLFFLVKFHRIFVKIYNFSWMEYMLLYGISFALQGIYGVLRGATGGPFSFWGVLIIPGIWVLSVFVYFCISGKTKRLKNEQ